jgi:hypothetical protein
VKWSRSLDQAKMKTNSSADKAPLFKVPLSNTDLLNLSFLPPQFGPFSLLLLGLLGKVQNWAITGIDAGCRVLLRPTTSIGGNLHVILLYF